MSADPLPDEVLLRFRQLAAERLPRAESLWLSLVQGAGAVDDAGELQRLVHTLKGDAQLVGLSEVELVCHKLEDLLAVARDLAHAVPDDVDLLVTMSFQLIGLLTRKRSGSAVAGIDMPGFVQEVDQVVRAAHALERSPGASPPGSVAAAPPDPALDQAARLARAAALAFFEHLGARGSARLRLHQLWRMLRQEVAQLLAAPLHPVVQRHAAAARELCAELHKLVEVEADAHGICVAARIADALDVGLLHCVRNAVDHGIELPDDRAATGKPRRGTIGIAAEHHGDAVTLVVEDDGRGLDRVAITQRARQAGLVDAVLDVHELLFRPGLSTAPHPSRLSGRGVGLDAVRSALTRVGGEVSVHGRPGGGTRVVMRVPAPLHHMQVHVIEPRAGVRLAIPADWELVASPVPGAHAADAVAAVAAVDPLTALGLPPAAAACHHAVTLRRGPLQVRYATSCRPRLATAQRICPTAPSDPMEVVAIGGHEVLVVRPDQLPGATRATAPRPDERAV